MPRLAWHLQRGDTPHPLAQRLQGLQVACQKWSDQCWHGACMWAHCVSVQYDSAALLYNYTLTRTPYCNPTP